MKCDDIFYCSRRDKEKEMTENLFIRQTER